MMIHTYTLNVPRKGHKYAMLFTNKMFFKNRLFPTQKVQNFQLCTLIMLFDRLPQVSCQYESSLNKALEEKIFLRRTKYENFVSLAHIARNNL